jgi:hypothetical protein
MGNIYRSLFRLENIMSLTKVEFAKATDAELQVAAHFAGADQLGSKAVAALEVPKLAPSQRKLLTTVLMNANYTGINVNLKQRVTDFCALLDFGVATPVR